MTKLLMLVTGTAPTGGTVDQTGLADRAVTDYTFLDLFGAACAEFAFAIDTLGGETRFVGQMTTGTKM